VIELVLESLASFEIVFFAQVSNFFHKPLDAFDWSRQKGGDDVEPAPRQPELSDFPTILPNPFVEEAGKPAGMVLLGE
jgi:hypothetical protein